MNERLGLAHFWANGDMVTHAVAILLFAMSVASWYLIVGIALSQWRIRKATHRVQQAYWGADDREQALEEMRRLDRSGLFLQMALEASQSHALHSRRAPGSEDLPAFLGRQLQQSLLFAQARLEHGLTLLASVGSTAPFVGLFGTVWGIYHALVGLSGSTQVVLDKVAGPVGEALIMTAAGLFVAIPAVLAYNAFTRGNRLALAHLEAFANALHADLVSGVRRPVAVNSAQG